MNGSTVHLNIKMRDRSIKKFSILNNRYQLAPDYIK